MLDDGATWNQLDGLLQWLLTEYGIGGDEDVDLEVSEEGSDDPKE